MRAKLKTKIKQLATKHFLLEMHYTSQNISGHNKVIKKHVQSFNNECGMRLNCTVELYTLKSILLPTTMSPLMIYLFIYMVYQRHTYDTLFSGT